MLYFFFNDTATTEIYTLSLHDALPIYAEQPQDDERAGVGRGREDRREQRAGLGEPDRKSTRLNSSHMSISYAVFCLKKKNKTLHILYIHHVTFLYSAHIYYFIS